MLDLLKFIDGDNLQMFLAYLYLRGEDYATNPDFIALVMSDPHWK